MTSHGAAEPRLTDPDTDCTHSHRDSGAPTPDQPRPGNQAHFVCPGFNGDGFVSHASTGAPGLNSPDPISPDSNSVFSRNLTSKSDLPVDDIDPPKTTIGSFLLTPHFWIIFIHGQILSLCIVSTNTMTSFMATNNVSIPAFQSLFNYALLLLCFLPYTIYKQGPSTFLRKTLPNIWKYFFLAFADCQGNYFIVKAYNYTNLLSAALLDNLSLVFVVIFSLLFLRVRYHWTQLLGIIVCIAGSVLIVLSDLFTGKNYAATDHIRGDLYVLLATFFYGLSNTLEEFLVSKKPIYEVLAMMGLLGFCIMGVQCAIFERESLATAQWSPKVGGYLTGYTLSLFIMYVSAPILFRMSSSAFYNLSLLTSDFWSLLIGIRVFGYYVFWLYPVGFVCTIIGVLVYYLVPTSLAGESRKPWLGSDQELGIAGVGTAKRKDGSVWGNPLSAKKPRNVQDIVKKWFD